MSHAQPTKAELEKRLEMVAAERDQLLAERDQLIEELRAQRESGPVTSTLEVTSGVAMLEPLLMGACVAALRNPITGIAYDELEFEAYAPAFVDQAVRLHNMILERLTEEEDKLVMQDTGNGTASISGKV